MHKKIDVVVIALSSPLQVGIYENGSLVETIQSEKKSSEVLPDIFQDILQKYSLNALYYANGPGSFMAIKIAYIFLKTISVVYSVPLYAADAFYFNGNQPIKAIGKLHFVKIQPTNKIETKPFDQPVANCFSLPKILNKNDFTTDSSPMYIIGAV